MLYLLPNLLSDDANPKEWFAGAVFDVVPRLDGLLCESAKQGRRYLKHFTFPEGKTFRDVTLLEINEHTSPKTLQEEILPHLQSGTWGLISDAGLPILADPGYQLTTALRKRGIPIQALPGPSSLIQALLLSGLPAQSFTFHGYLPRDPKARTQALKQLKSQHTHLFIEAPYRNQQLFDALLTSLKPTTLLCIAKHLTAPDETVLTLPIAAWRKTTHPTLSKIPTLFLLHSPT